VEVREAPRERQADPEPLVAVGPEGAPLEQAEDAFEVLAGEADPVVADLRSPPARPRRRRARSGRPAAGTSPRSREEVREDLREAHGVSLDEDALRGKVDGERVPAGVESGADRFERSLDDLGKRDRLLAKDEAAARDAGEVEQVVDEPGEVRELAAEDGAREGPARPGLLVGRLLGGAE
jgi:hypothetical protein